MSQEQETEGDAMEPLAIRARRAALDAAEARIRAIPLAIDGPEGPDRRIAERAVEIVEAMRQECIAALRAERP